MDADKRTGIDAPPDMVGDGFGILSGRHVSGYTGCIYRAPTEAVLPLLLIVADAGGLHVLKRLYPDRDAALVDAKVRFGAGWRWKDNVTAFVQVMLGLRPRGRIARREAALRDPSFMLADRYRKKDLRQLCDVKGLSISPKDRKIDMARLYVEAVGRDRVLGFLNIEPEERS